MRLTLTGGDPFANWHSGAQCGLRAGCGGSNSLGTPRRSSGVSTPQPGIVDRTYKDSSTRDCMCRSNVEGNDDTIAVRECLDTRAYFFHDSGKFVAERSADSRISNEPVLKVQIGSADGRTRDTQHDVVTPPSAW